jgi:hypothetical protein
MNTVDMKTVLMRPENVLDSILEMTPLKHKCMLEVKSVSTPLEHYGYIMMYLCLETYIHTYLSVKYKCIFLYSEGNVNQTI